MRIADMNWMQLADYLAHDDRAVVPLGSTEQHCCQSLTTDLLLSERLAAEACAPLGVPVFPGLAYGVVPDLLAFPGTVSLRVSTFVALLRDVLDSLASHGFRRIILLNAHGGNSPAGLLATEWMADHPGHRTVLHDWWGGPRLRRALTDIDPVGSHGSWMDNFPWNRVAPSPETAKPMIDAQQLRGRSPVEVREVLGDGNFGGVYARPDDVMIPIWVEAVEETRDFIAQF